MALIDLANLKKKDLRIIEITDRKKFIKDAAENGYDYAIDNLRKIYCYEIITTRQKTNHPTKIIVNINLLMPYLYPFGSYIDGEKILSENELAELQNLKNISREYSLRKVKAKTNYLEYLKNLNTLAKKLDTKSENIEMFLFFFGKNLY